uniref:Uncharacterized protein n=1 Tax=Oryza brachyantha TaxID=4533 RepID=J3MKC9_ORYBR
MGPGSIYSLAWPRRLSGAGAARSGTSLSRPENYTGVSRAPTSSSKIMKSRKSNLPSLDLTECAADAVHGMDDSSVLALGPADEVDALADLDHTGERACLPKLTP